MAAFGGGRPESVGVWGLASSIAKVAWWFALFFGRESWIDRPARDRGKRESVHSFYNPGQQKSSSVLFCPSPESICSCLFDSDFLSMLCVVQRRCHQPSQIDGSLRRRKSSLNSIQVVVHEALALFSAASSSPAQHSGIHPLLLAARFFFCFILFFL
jgi:hypothetical protein